MRDNSLLDIRGAIPTVIHLSEARWHDVNMLDQILPEPGAFYVMDRGYMLCAAFCVVRTKENVLPQRRYSREVDKSTGLRSDHTVILTANNSAKAHPNAMRRVSY